jgi:molybdate transport system substrate-binding protein
MIRKVLMMASLLSGFLAGCSSREQPAADDTVAEITVAAASDLRPAFEQLGQAFSTATGTKVTFSFGSSGQLKEQIVNGAPFDLFASANATYIDDVIAAGRGVQGTKAEYALGRIVLWSGDASNLPASLADLSDQRYAHIAIANPDHAPYGAAAKEALISAGVFDMVKDRLVFGENISDTFEIAKSGNAQVGIVALSLAIADGRPYTLIPADAHTPLRQALVVTSTGAAGSSAKAFSAFVASPAGRKVMIQFGFVLPGEDLAETSTS